MARKPSKQQPEDTVAEQATSPDNNEIKSTSKEQCVTTNKHDVGGLTFYSIDN